MSADKSAMRFLRTATAVLTLALTLPCLAADKKEIITLESIRIHGDQESPVVVYIVPWQAPVQNELDVQTANAVLRPLQPLDRESFQRMLSYHQLFQLQVNAEKKETSGQ
jgi:hypothetical protein